MRPVLITAAVLALSTTSGTAWAAELKPVSKSQQSQLNKSSQTRIAIIGGSPVASGAYPYAVRLESLYPNQQGELEQSAFCSGSIIAPQHVLTAAHCVSGDQLDQRIEELKPQVRLANLPGSPVIAVTRAAFWRDYDLKAPSKDLAVLELAQPAPVSPVSLAAIPPSGSPVKELGYGPTKKDLKDGMRSNLYQGDMRVAEDQQACYELLGEEGVYTQTEICAVTSPEAGLNAGACPGDSGGPLLNQQGAQVGVTSWGQLENCNVNAELRSTVFARADAGQEWLRRQTGAELFGLPATSQQTQTPEQAELNISQASRRGMTITASAAGEDWVARVLLEAQGRKGKRRYRADAIIKLTPQASSQRLTAPYAWRKKKLSRVTYQAYSRFFNSIENGQTVISNRVSKRYR